MISRIGESMEETRFGIYSTFILGDDGKVYDLAGCRFLPGNVSAVNAWTEKVGELDSKGT